MTRLTRGTAAAVSTFVVLAAVGSGCDEGGGWPGQGGDDGSGAAPIAAPPAAPGVLRGELLVYIMTFDDGTSEEAFYLKLGEEERRLHFSASPDLAPGTIVDVRGFPHEDGLFVTSVTEVASLPASVSQTRQALIQGMPKRARRFAFVMVDVGGGVRYTKAELEQRLYGTQPGMTPSVRQYYVEASYGVQDIGGDVLGPFTFEMQGCNTGAMARTLREQIPGDYDHYLWFLGSRVQSCGWTGLAAGGRADRPSRDSWYNGSAGCVVLMQEPGHNFGMAHSSSMTCNGGRDTFVDAPEDACTHSEYGDRYDPMGRACFHMNGYQKAYQGWLGGCNLAEIKESGTFTLLPLELPCDGLQVLKIPMPKTRPFFRSGGGGRAGLTELTHYYVELRAPHGIDRMLQPEVQIRASGDIRGSTQRGLHTWFLDMVPGTPRQDGLKAGGTFTDPAQGVTISVVSVDANQASIRVQFPEGAAPGGPATCLDGTTLTAPGPGPNSCAATPAIPDTTNAPRPDAGAPDPTPPPDAAPPNQMGGSGGTGGSGGMGGSSGAGGSAGAPTGIENPSRGGTGGTTSSAGTGGSATPRGGAAGSAPSSEEPPPEVKPAGCACDLNPANDQSSRPGALILILALAALLGRRRRLL